MVEVMYKQFKDGNRALAGMSFQQFQDSEKKLASFPHIVQTWFIVPYASVLGARASELPLLKFSQAYQEVKAALEYILEEQ